MAGSLSMTAEQVGVPGKSRVEDSIMAKAQKNKRGTASSLVSLVHGGHKEHEVQLGRDRELRNTDSPVGNDWATKQQCHFRHPDSSGR